MRARAQAQDFVGASALFLLILMPTLLVVSPVLFISDAAIALRLSNAIVIASLFSIGYAVGVIGKVAAGKRTVMVEAAPDGGPGTVWTPSPGRRN
ncbi:hypothetical protein AM571_PC01334 (plasmid) [Rhizobium etli 8C-3]|uniref:Uncharacterized protein n=1 Tax=Rhizobium etli 8C-3 TaxID=538025 RepID=A0A1L5PGK0_RHIET|nr:hypothetical protein AM571_PC01334 [Rhizobium etli 8C-3]